MLQLQIHRYRYLKHAFLSRAPPVLVILLPLFPAGLSGAAIAAIVIASLLAAALLGLLGIYLVRRHNRQGFSSISEHA